MTNNKMTYEQVQEKVYKVLKDKCAYCTYLTLPKEITNDSVLATDFNMESLDEVECIMDMEKYFGITIEQTAAEKIKTVGDIVNYIYDSDVATIHKTSPTNKIVKVKANLVKDLREFVQSRKFSDVVFGLSGGMDSALVLALAAEALGPQHVHTFMMATKNTSGLSIELAKQLSYNIGNPHQFIDIQPRVDCALKTLPFVPQRRTTVENIQARIRGDICMTYSNEYNWMVLSCGNKSEAAMGYCTLYGDTCGAVMPIGDLYKTEVYKMAELYPAIPQGIITRAPSAELSPNQRDSDSLPEYSILDAYLQKIEAGEQDENEQMADIRKKYNAMAFKRIQMAPAIKVRER